MKPKLHGNSERCEVCDAWTKYNGRCAVHEVSSVEDDLRYRGMWNQDLTLFAPGLWQIGMTEAQTI